MADRAASKKAEWTGVASYPFNGRSSHAGSSLSDPKRTQVRISKSSFKSTNDKGEPCMETRVAYTIVWQSTLANGSLINNWLTVDDVEAFSKVVEVSSQQYADICAREKYKPACITQPAALKRLLNRDSDSEVFGLVSEDAAITFGSQDLGGSSNLEDAEVARSGFVLDEADDSSPTQIDESAVERVDPRKTKSAVARSNTFADRSGKRSNAHS